MNFSAKLNLSLLASLILLVACGNGARSRYLATSSDPRGDLVKAMKAVFNTKSYRVKSTTTTSDELGEGKSTMEVEFVAPDRWHSVFESNLYPYNNQKMEWIVVGGKSYWKVGDQQWQQSEKDMSVLFRISNTQNIERVAKTDVKFIGDDVLDGAPMLVYQYQTSTVSDKESKSILVGDESVIKIWIGAKDGLPHKTEKESETEVKDQGLRIKSKETTIYSDYNTDIKIEPPM